MNIRNKLIGSLTMLTLSATAMAQGEWTLQDCLDYAAKNNIQIQKAQIAEQQGEVSLSQYRGQLLPSLSFSTNQSLGYRPFQETMAIVTDGHVSNSSKKVTEQGSYGLNASWTVWNGNVNRMNIRNQKLKNQQASLTTQQNELTIQERITNLYISILYSTEAQHVAEKLAETTKMQWNRGQQMLENGKMAKADVTALQAQHEAALYDIINSQTQVANFKRQLKALLELDINTPFDVVSTEPTDEQVMMPIPSAQSVYEQALVSRPEIRNAELSIEEAELQEKIARAGYQPTIALAGNINDSHYTGSAKKTGEQMKTNLNASLGLNVQVPLFDQRRTKSAVAQAKLQRTSSELDLRDKQLALSSTIEDYWLSAVNNQQKYVSSRTTLSSQQESYEQLNEQFKEGLKNIVELMQGRDNLLRAEQNMLQSKYNTLLYMELLKFYQK